MRTSFRIATRIWFCFLPLVLQASGTSPIRISLTPLSVTLTISQTQQFTATAGRSSYRLVKWSLSPAVGTISAAGLYTAPATMSAPQTVTVTATSVIGPVKSASATVTLAPPVNISLTPLSVALTASQTQQFIAKVGGASNSAVTWTCSPAVGTVSAGGLYTSPPTIPAAQTVTVKATSVADPSKSATATVTLTPQVTISLTPSSASLLPSNSRTFTATVGGTSNSAVTWSINPPLGTISSAGLYTAPSTILTPQTVTLTARSVADPAKSASVTISLNPSMTVSLTPSTTSLTASQSQRFAVAVTGTTDTRITWTVNPPTGTFSTSDNIAVYTAPSTITAGQNVEVSAISMTDSSKFSKSVITLIPTILMSLTPTSVELQEAQSQQFTAAVSGTTDQTVNWSLSPAIGIISTTGLYTAPATVLAAQTVTVTAHSAKDTTKSASGVVSLNAAPLNVKSFGAKGDGSTNDKPAFDAAFAAIKSAGGGQLYVPTGQYLYNSSSSFSDTQTFDGEASNVVVFGDGATVSVINFTGTKGLYLGLPREDINRYCTNPPNKGCINAQSWGLPSYYLMGNVSSGSSVTLTTHAQASNFTPGTMVFIQSGDAAPGTGHPPAHFEFNTVASANPSTGVINLQNPLSDSYESSNLSYPPMIAPISTVPSNLTIHDLGFTTNKANATIISLEGTANTVIDKCAFTALGGTDASIWNGYSWHTTIKNSQFSGVSADLGDAGAYFEFRNNVVQNMPRSINGYGSGRQWLFDGNQLTGPQIAGPSTAIDIGGSATYSMIGLQISNNSIHLSDVSSYPNGISVFDAVGTTVRGNTFFGVTASDNGGAGVALRAGAVKSEVSQNVVRSQNLKYGVLLQSGASGSLIHDNEFDSTRMGINVLGGATNTNVGCNSFVSNGTNCADYGSGTIYTCSSR